MRGLRPMRHTRLSPVHRIANFVEDARRWFGDVFRAGQQIEAAAEKAERSEAAKPTESVKPEEKMSESTKSPAVGEAQKQTVRPKSAPNLKPSSDTKRSRGVGI
jgi:hypothetical protein